MTDEQIVDVIEDMLAGQIEEAGPACGALVAYGEFRDHARAHRDEGQA